jgi:hypothetical protein
MRDAGWMRKTERRGAPEAIAQGQAMLCIIEDCDNPAFRISGICESCQDEIDALKTMADQSGLEYTKFGKPARRLEDFAWATAAITLCLYLLWELRGWFIEWFEMWLQSGS